MVKKKTPIKKTVKPKPEKRPAIAAKGRVEGELAFDELKTVLLQRFNDFELKL